mmetsp:Transcript_106587/g.267179  ORF Transcript_106587/g.267179 Transcript_106587/m.267179 type:complete len:204 (+) Transcript_106587:503-1114(+)
MPQRNHPPIISSMEHPSAAPNYHVANPELQQPPPNHQSRWRVVPRIDRHTAQPKRPQTGPLSHSRRGPRPRASSRYGNAFLVAAAAVLQRAAEALTSSQSPAQPRAARPPLAQLRQATGASDAGAVRGRSRRRPSHLCRRPFGRHPPLSPLPQHRQLRSQPPYRRPPLLLPRSRDEGAERGLTGSQCRPSPHTARMVLPAILV